MRNKERELVPPDARYADHMKAGPVRPAELTGLPLFREEESHSGGLPPYQKGSDTSRDAASSVAESAPTKRAEVYGYILARGKAGATDAEIESGLAMLRQSVCARRNELAKLGMIRDSGRRRTSLHTGRRCAVWVVRTGR